MGDVNPSSHQSQGCCWQAGVSKASDWQCFCRVGREAISIWIWKSLLGKSSRMVSSQSSFSTLGDTVLQGRGRWWGERERRGGDVDVDKVTAQPWDDSQRRNGTKAGTCSSLSVLGEDYWKKPTERGRRFLEKNSKHGDTRKQSFQHRMAQNKNTTYHAEIGREEKMDCPGPDKGCALSHLIKGFRPCLNDGILEVTLRTPPWVSC